MRRLIATLVLILASSAVAEDELPTWQQHPSKNKPRQHVMIQFTDMSLHPSIAQVLEGGTVSWVNYGSMYEGSVVFSEEVAEAFTCKELRPGFMKTGTGYQSIPITQGGMNNDLEIPCPLKPGEYEYEIWLYTIGQGGVGGMSDPQSQLQGKIVVE